MSEALTLAAETRDRAGKGASRMLRREGRVPAVVYGGNEAPLSIHVEAKELARQLGTGHFLNSIVEIVVDGKTMRTLPKDVAFHPVSDRALHVDFLRLAANSSVHVEVPVLFINEAASPGIKRGTSTCTLELAASRRKSTCSARSETGWKATSLGSVRMVLPSTTISTIELRK